MFCAPETDRNGRTGRMKEGRSSRLRRKVSWFPGAKFAEQKGTDPVKQDSEELVKEDSTQIKQSGMASSMKPGPRAHQAIGNSSGSFRQKAVDEVEGWTAAEIKVLKLAVDEVSSLQSIKPPNFTAIQVYFSLCSLSHSSNMAGCNKVHAAAFASRAADTHQSSGGG